MLAIGRDAVRGPAPAHCGNKMGNTALPEHGAADQTDNRIRYRLSTAKSKVRKIIDTTHPSRGYGVAD